ncbi:MAG: DUF6029 family protein [Bacteroidales bacterium]
MKQRIIRNKVLFLLAVVLFLSNTSILKAGELLPGARVWGNFEFDSQYYFPDSIIGAPDVPEKILMNAFANINVSYQNFTFGMRYESYQNPMLGYDPRYKGSGIPYRFASYTKDNLEVTVGNFYEQFGSGLIFRSYEERNLGIDNAMDGIKLIYRPAKGYTLKGLIGQQRFYFDKGPGILRGFDTEVNLNEALQFMSESANRWIIGAGIVSKFQKDQDPLYNLPENVSAMAGRINYTRKTFNFSTEYAYKINDPSADNNFIYKDGHGLTASASYATPGFGFLLSAKRIDNMGFRSDRYATGNDLHVNYLPPTTRQHLYSLSGMYPYATQPNGEAGLLSELTFKLPRKSTLGGPFGTTVTLNYSIANSIHKEKVHDTISIGQTGTLGYNSDFFSLGDEKYFEDINVEISRRMSRNLRGLISYAYITYNQNVIEGYVDKEMVYAHVVIADFSYRLPNRQSIRWELQHLETKQDKGSWAMALIEYTISPNWFFAVSDQYNYGNKSKEYRLHYYNISAGYTYKANRFAVSYGRQREGIVCVGGVCRQLPASTGFALNITSSF